MSIKYYVKERCFVNAIDIYVAEGGNKVKLLIIKTTPIGPDGITNVIRNLFCGMDKKDMHTDIVVINEPGSSFRTMFEAAGGSVYVIPRNIKSPLKYINALRRQIKAEKYDLVHAHGNSATLSLEMIAAWLAGCKVRIAHSHNTSCRHKTVHYLLSGLFRCLCTHRLACGEAAGRWMHGKKPFQVVNNGVDTQRFSFQESVRTAIRQQYAIGPQEILIGHVGYFNEVKNQSFLVDILHALTKAGQSYRLMLIGVGEHLEKVKQKAQDLGVQDNVIFLGKTDKVAQILSAFDVYVMPSILEGLPLSLIEAQANGLPCVISTNITNEADKTGNILFLPLQEGANYWAEGIQHLELPENRNKASEQAIEKIKACGYDVDTCAAWLKEYYYKAVGK